MRNDRTNIFGKKCYLFFYSFDRDNLTSLDKFNMEINENELYPKDSKWVDEVLHEMATRKIVKVGEYYYINTVLNFFLNYHSTWS